MKTKNALTLIAAVSTALFAQATLAQSTMANPASGPTPARAEVKAETRAAAQTGQLTPAGQGVKPKDSTSTMSTKGMSDTRSETQETAKEGKLTPAGQGNPADMNAASAVGPRAHMGHKAKTKAEMKSGQTIPAGEGPDSPKK